jgi:hypothetical protein
MQLGPPDIQRSGNTPGSTGTLSAADTRSGGADCAEPTATSAAHNARASNRFMLDPEA